MLISVFTSCSKVKYDTVMEYNGIELKENMYYYWLSTFKKNILSYYGEVKWDEKTDDGRTIEQYFTDIIGERVKNYLIAQSLYKDNRLKLPNDIKDAIDADIKEKIDYYGSRGELNAELKNLKLDINSLKDVYTWEEKHEVVYDYFYGEGGVEEISNAELAKYYRENYSQIKYIVFYKTKIKKDDKGNYVYDAEGNVITEELTKEELEAKEAKIQECMDKIDSGSSFEDLRKEYSEYDTSAYPTGFFVSKNEITTWGEQIVIGASNAKVGEVYKVTEGDAVYLVLKCQLTELSELSDSELEQLSKLSVNATAELYDKKFSELYKDITVYDEILSKYKLSEIPANPYYSI